MKFIMFKVSFLLCLLTVTSIADVAYVSGSGSGYASSTVDDDIKTKWHETLSTTYANNNDPDRYSLASAEHFFGGVIDYAFTQTQAQEKDNGGELKVKTYAQKSGKVESDGNDNQNEKFRIGFSGWIDATSDTGSQYFLGHSRIGDYRIIWYTDNDYNVVWTFKKGSTLLDSGTYPAINTGGKYYFIIEQDVEIIMLNNDEVQFYLYTTQMNSNLTAGGEKERTGNFKSHVLFNL